MFQTFYTTKMSGNAKTLQKRFSKIRSGKSKTARFMAMIMTVAILAATLGGAVVLAAIGEDGLEHWIHKELFYNSGMKFSVNISGKSTPEWVNSIAGTNGNVNISLDYVSLRKTDGWMTDGIIGTFSGSNGIEKFSFLTATTGTDSDKIFHMCFTGSTDAENNPFGISPHDGRSVTIDFKINDDNLIDDAKLYFHTNPLTSPGNLFKGNADHSDDLYAQNIDIIGDFYSLYKKIIYAKSSSQMFNPYEINYKNKKAEGIDIKVLSADNSQIKLNIDSSLDKVENYRIYVYNADFYGVNSMIGYEKTADGFQAIPMFQGDKGKETVISKDGKTVIINAPSKVSDTFRLKMEQYLSAENLEGKYFSGETYRVEVGLMDEGKNLIYRWQEYVTIP